MNIPTAGAYEDAQCIGVLRKHADPPLVKSIAPYSTAVALVAAMGRPLKKMKVMGTPMPTLNCSQQQHGMQMPARAARTQYAHAVAA